MGKYKFCALILAFISLSPTYAIAIEKEPSLQEQISELQRQLKILQDKLEKQEKVEKEKSASDIKISMKPSPVIKTQDGKYSIQPVVMIHADAGFFNDDKVDHPDGTNFRRARLGIKGIIDEVWNYKAEYDFAKEQTNFKELYMTYTGLKPFEFRVGNFKPPFSLEEYSGSGNTTFMEVSSVSNSFVTGEITGAAINSGGENWSSTLGIFNDDAGKVGTDDEAWSFHMRGAYAPVTENDKVIHLGLSGVYKLPDHSTNTFIFGSTAENGLDTTKLVNITVPATVDNATLGGLELAGVFGSFSVQGEYIGVNINRQSGSDPFFSGWYVQTSYAPTGESRPYDAKTGKFSKLKPARPFSLEEEAWGAWEIAARYSHVDLNDAGLIGGEMNNWTGGINWYLNPNLRLMVNYVFVNTAINGPAGVADDDPQILMFRTQFDL